MRKNNCLPIIFSVHLKNVVWKEAFQFFHFYLVLEELFIDATPTRHSKKQFHHPKTHYARNFVHFLNCNCPVGGRSLPGLQINRGWLPSVKEQENKVILLVIMENEQTSDHREKRTFHLTMPFAKYHVLL